ncbi:magnesium transporter CorA family protein [Raoultibacter phocaeensis]|uniref:magnesium transporter CorA family protein n=1 Tax=Raoultibacter phocaeensis TaxID=2479841 RepID=UPI0015D5C3D5|nr:CorA family divalent cation transporter [Raoultibacter phocaeensis]
MPALYRLTDRLEAIDPEEEIDSAEPVVEVLKTDELDSIGISDIDALESLKSLAASQSTYVDVFPDCMIGSLSIPDKADLLKAPACFGFYLDTTRLIFVDNGDVCESILDGIASMHRTISPTLARVLYEFLKFTVKDDAVYLADVEEKLGDTEETILDRKRHVTNNHMLQIRRKILRLDSYYQQLSDMSSVMSDDEHRMLAKEERRLFHLFSEQCDRLMDRAQSLKDYSLQLRELFQMQIDTQQNEIMQWFTVITTIFVPLTLITSWYGMNFEAMPELAWPFSYPIVIIVCIVLVIIEIRFFKRKKWL